MKLVQYMGSLESFCTASATVAVSPEACGESVAAVEPPAVAIARTAFGTAEIVP